LTVIGRDADAQLVVQDPSVSRAHAQVLLSDGEARITDLDSHNGVRVNGEQVKSAELQSGDVVVLGDVTFVFHCGERPIPLPPLLGPVPLRELLARELERAATYEREVSVLAIHPGRPSPPLADLLRKAADALQLIDSVGQSGTSLMFILPELTGEEAAAAGQHLLEALLPIASQARAGLATAPEGGLDAEALLGSARAAALAASPGTLQVSRPGAHIISLGERSVLIADPPMVEVYERLRRLAASAIPVLINGETGTGKENAAFALHHWSPRVRGPFVTQNCAALPEGLAESELFGHERGAFSGADKARAGRFEQASGGTFFLDEIAELSLANQAKLLRVLDQKRVVRLGDSREREVDVRVVAATHRTLPEEVKAGRFREDLYFRLSAATVCLLPLRDRPRELPLLAGTFLAQACSAHGRPPLRLSAAAMRALGAHSWPGNVRELRNAMEAVAAEQPETTAIVEPSHLPAWARDLDDPDGGAESGAEEPQGTQPDLRSFRPLAEEVRQLERQRMSEALEATGGVQTRAARLLGMPIRTFSFKLRQYRLPVPGKGSPP